MFSTNNNVPNNIEIPIVDSQIDERIFKTIRCFTSRDEDFYKLYTDYYAYNRDYKTIYELFFNDSDYKDYSLPQISTNLWQTALYNRITTDVNFQLPHIYNKNTMYRKTYVNTQKVITYDDLSTMLDNLKFPKEFNS